MGKPKYNILLKIINMCVGVASKTRMVYPANLNFRTVSHIMNMIIRAHVSISPMFCIN